MDKSRLGVDMLAAVERGLARDPKSLPKIERDRRSNGGGNGATVELLKVLLKQIAMPRVSRRNSSPTWTISKPSPVASKTTCRLYKAGGANSSALKPSISRTGDLH